MHRELKWLEENPEFLEVSAERARPYLHFIVEEAERRGLPLEVVLLPVIESGFEPSARSPFNASGLWQFMPGTARAMGLKRSNWYEGSRDIVASTRAALDYLQDLSDQFDGDWELALAAYNCGPGTVRRALRRNREQDKPTDFWALDLPPVTQTYVPRLLAINRAIQAPDSFGIDLPDLPNQPEVAEIRLPRQIDLNLAAHLADMETGEIRRLNPGLLRDATDPEGPHRLLLPVDRARSFRLRLAELAPSRWQATGEHLVRRGDTLSQIAERYGVGVSELRRMNRLATNDIRAGTRLLIPDHQGLEGDSGQGEDAAPTRPAPARQGDTYYRVRPGDNLWDIARRHGLDHRQLAAWNDLDRKDTLRPGQRLRLVAASDAVLESPYAYRVRPGDSLSGIARRFGVTVKELRGRNDLTGDRLQPGQVLSIPRRERQTFAL
jgi:membrane-bound lytic murein transglycosylase D